jgi:hypothetical protein
MIPAIDRNLCRFELRLDLPQLARELIAQSIKLIRQRTRQALPVGALDTQRDQERVGKMGEQRFQSKRTSFFRE